MSAKPATVPAWAGTGAITVPIAGKQSVGFVPAERGAAQYLNWMQNLNGQWLQYLNDGNMTGAWTFASTVDITGRLTALERIYTTVGYYGAAGAIALAPAGLRASVLRYTTADEDSIPVSVYRDPNGTHTPNGSGNAILLAASTNRIVIPIFKPAGTILTAYNVNVLKTTSSARTMHARLYKCHADGTESAAGIDFANSDNSPGATFIAASGDPITLLAGYQYYIVMTPTGFAGDTLQHADVFCTRPA